MDNLLKFISGSETITGDSRENMNNLPSIKISLNVSAVHIAAITDIQNALKMNRTDALKILIEAGFLYLNSSTDLKAVGDIIGDVFSEYVEGLEE